MAIPIVFASLHENVQSNVYRAVTLYLYYGGITFYKIGFTGGDKFDNEKAIFGPDMQQPKVEMLLFAV